MKKQALFMVVLLAAVALLAGVAASSAFAIAGGYASPCSASGCHGTAGAAPTVTLTTQDATTATYAVSDATAFEWAVFYTDLFGSTRITGTGNDGNTATGGSFTVPVGSTYDVYAVYSSPGFATSGGHTTVSPGGVATDYTITPTAGANGTISPATPQTVASGGSVTFTMTPAQGYNVADVVVNGTSVGAVTSYQFANVTAAGTISVTFAPITGTTYTITPTAGANGSITPATAQSVAAGDDLAFDIRPDAGYYVDTLMVDGTAVQPTTSYKFTSVDADHTIAATFAASPAMCSISASVVDSIGGTIVPGAPVWVIPSGGGIDYYFVPDAGYHVDTVLVDGWPVALDEDNVFSFTGVNRNHTVSVKFAANKWTISASVSGKGSITPTGANEVLEGLSVTYTFTPDAGNQISDVVVDGVSVGIVGSYTFDDVTANHKIQAKFVPQSVNYTITPSVVGASGGMIMPSVLFVVPSGGSVTCYFMPNAGYQVGTVSVDGTAVDPNMVDDNAYTFGNVAANHTIAVTFVPVATYAITPTAGTHGSISPAAAQTVSSGDDASFTITPDAGYHIVDVLVDGQSKGAIESYEFTGVTANHTISASFAWTKLATSTALKASARTIKRNGYVTLTATLKGGTFTNTTIRFEVKVGHKAYKLLKTVKVSSTGVAKYRYKVTARGTRYHRVKFLGNDTYLPAPLKAGVKLVVK